MLSGGKAIASGGFGCVFRPALKIEGQTERSPGKVSKLMEAVHAQEEYDMIQTYKALLSDIPNYADYFLLDGFEIGQPKPLDTDDLNSVDNKCSNLKKYGITSVNINSAKNLQQLKVLNMPDGGDEIDTFIAQHEYSPQIIAEVNNAMLDLLQNGILPMNAKGVYHCDIKDSNLLVSRDSKTGILRVKLIDWGLSTSTSSDDFPQAVSHRPIQYNIPVSVIIFTNEFNLEFDKLLLSAIVPVPHDEIRACVIQYVSQWINNHKKSHIEILYRILSDIFISRFPQLDTKTGENIIESFYLYYYIVDYITSIIVSVTTSDETGNHAAIDSYLMGAFLHNVDIWGFIMSYKELLHYYAANPSLVAQYELMRRIFIDFLLNTPTTKIDVGILAETLKRLTADVVISTATVPTVPTVSSIVVQSVPVSPQTTAESTSNIPQLTSVAPPTSPIVVQNSPQSSLSPPTPIKDSDFYIESGSPTPQLPKPHKTSPSSLGIIDTILTNSTNLIRATSDPLTQLSELFESGKTRKKHRLAVRKQRQTRKK